MKKRFFALILALTVLACMGVSASALDHSCVVDEAGVLTAEEVQMLDEYAADVTQKHCCEVAVVFVQNLGGKSSVAYADDYYDYNGFGYGENDDGILLLVSVGDREFATTTYGLGAVVFSDYNLSILEDDYFVPELAGSNWAGAAEAFIYGCDAMLTYYENSANEAASQTSGGGYVGGYEAPTSGRSNIGGYAIFGLIGSFLLAGIPTGMMKKKLKSVEKQYSANEYARAGSFMLRRNNDRFLYAHVSKTARPKQEDNSSHGSTMHISSSGRSHGGSSGKF